MTRILTLFSAAALSATLSTTASAATFTQTFSSAIGGSETYTFNPNTGNVTGGSWAAPSAITKSESRQANFVAFDPSMGNLQRIDMTLRTTTPGNNKFRFKDFTCKTFTTVACAEPQSGGYVIQSYADLRIAYDISRSSLLNPGFVPDGYPGIAFERDIHTFDAGASSFPDTTWDPSRRTLTSSLLPGHADFSSMIGQGTRQLFPRVSYMLDNWNNGCQTTFVGVHVTKCSSTVEVVYNFTFEVDLAYVYDPVVTPPPSAVPLPAGFPMLLTGLALLAVLRRRR